MNVHVYIWALTGEESRALSDLLETELSVTSRCIRCGEMSTGSEKKLMLTLNYQNCSEHLNLSVLIEKALHFRGQREGNCQACLVTTRMEETRKVKRLPPIILVDANPGNPKFAEFWQDQLKLSEFRPRYKKPDKECSLEGGTKSERPCRYGSDCRNRLYCKYSHGFDDWEAECATWLEDTGGDWKHFASESFYSRISNGIAILSEQALERESDTYVLMAIVSAIGDESGQWMHTITQLNDREKELPWSIINETLVTRIHSNESLHLNAKWKLPLILCYVNKSSGLADVVERRRLIPPSVFHTDSNLTGNEDVARERRECDIPSQGEVIGIDAEFINISKDHGRKSVGRVSCVDSTGSKILIDDYVVTCDGDVVDDYLTQYSGIMEDDLNPHKSTKHLTTLKRVYLKILHLVEQGCLFVGHALNNDFSVLNIYVPPEQLKDTVQLFHLPQQRMISLQFLAWHLLGEKIQEGFHDSVEDARVALKLYRKWEELNIKGTLDSVVRALYDTGKQCNWRLGTSPSKSLSPFSDSVKNSSSVSDPLAFASNDAETSFEAV